MEILRPLPQVNQYLDGINHQPPPLPPLPPQKTCQYFLSQYNRTCLRKLKDPYEDYCYQHKHLHNLEILQPEDLEESSNQENNSADNSENNSADNSDEPNTEPEPPGDCPICLVELDENLCKLDPCEHLFHAICFLQLHKMECPICRRIPTNIPRYMMRRLDRHWVAQHPEINNYPLNTTTNHLQPPTEDAPNYLEPIPYHPPDPSEQSDHNQQINHNNQLNNNQQSNNRRVRTRPRGFWANVRFRLANFILCR